MLSGIDLDSAMRSHYIFTYLLFPAVSLKFSLKPEISIFPVSLVLQSCWWDFHSFKMCPNCSSISRGWIFFSFSFSFFLFFWCQVNIYEYHNSKKSFFLLAIVPNCFFCLWLWKNCMDSKKSKDSVFWISRPHTSLYWSFSRRIQMSVQYTTPVELILQIVPIMSIFLTSKALYVTYVIC